MGYSKRTVALKYDFNASGAPKIIAKGWGSDGKLMEEIARENQVPIKNSPGLADVLYRLPVLAEIPEELYEVIAVIYLELARVDQTLRMD